MGRDEIGQGRHSHDKSFAPVYAPLVDASPASIPDAEISDAVSSFRAEVHGLILEGKLSKIPALVADHSQLTKQDYGDYIVTRAQFAKTELDNARGRHYRTGVMQWDPEEMTSVQKGLTQMIKYYSAPPAQGENFCSGRSQQHKPESYKACCGH